DVKPEEEESNVHLQTRMSAGKKVPAPRARRGASNRESSDIFGVPMPGSELMDSQLLLGASGEALVDPAHGHPAHKARAVTFADLDPLKSMVHGHILITPAADESDVTHYNIFWASNRTARTLIRSVARGITSYHLHDPVDHSKGVKIPAGVNQLMVKTSNSLGMMQDGVTVDIWDYWQPAFTSLLKGLFRGG
ncbi:unnamed protein product, partial [Polarella glacialis]